MKTTVLFLCTGNSARSQMAEGLLRHLAGTQFEAFSAGTKPAGLNPAAVAAMRTIGVDITGQRSKHVDEFLNSRFDYVVTVCDRAKEECPLFPGATRMLHWTFDDPAAAQGSLADRQQVFDRVRDEIRDHLTDFLKQQGPAANRALPA